MDAPKTPLPRWFLIWRFFVWSVLIVMFAGIAFTLPTVLASLQAHANPTPQQIAQLIKTNTYIPIAIAIAVVPVGLVLLIIGFCVSLLTRRQRPLKMRQLTLPTLIFVVLLVMGVYALALMGPVVITSLDFSFSTNSHGPCLPAVGLVAFVDQNGNGVRDANEAGLAHVHVTAVISEFTTSGYTDSIKTFETDDNGYVQVLDHDPADTTYLSSWCPTRLMLIQVDVPQGYQATTSTKFNISYDDNMGYNVGEYAGFR